MTKHFPIYIAFALIHPCGFIYNIHKIRELKWISLGAVKKVGTANEVEFPGRMLNHPDKFIALFKPQKLQSLLCFRERLSRRQLRTKSCFRDKSVTASLPL